MNLTDSFVYEKLTQIDATARKTGDYQPAFSLPYVMSNYLYRIGNLDELSDKTIDLCLDVSFSGYNQYYIPKLKNEAFEIYKNEHGVYPTAKTLDDLTQLQKERLALYRVEKNAFKELNILFPYLTKNNNPIFKQAKKNLDDKGLHDSTEGTFYSLATRLNFSRDFYFHTLESVDKWDPALPAEAEWNKWGKRQKINCLADMQITLEQSLDPGLALKTLASTTRPNVSAQPFEKDRNFQFIRHFSLMKAKPISYINGVFDESTLQYMDASYLHDFDIFASDTNYFSLKDPSEDDIAQIYQAIASIKSKGKRKSLQCDLIENALFLTSGGFFNYEAAPKIVLHESVHQHQHKCYFSYLADPVQTTALSGMTSRDFKIFELANIFYINSKGNKNSYEDNPNEKHAYFVQNDFSTKELSRKGLNLKS